MIYTLTMNPAIDLFIATEHMKKDEVNRTQNADIQANGKGVNVSFILHRLGVENTALGVGGGFTLAYIEETLQKNDIPTDFVQVDGITRINVFTQVLSEKAEYKLVNPGPQVAADKLEELLDKLKSLTSADTLIVSGSFARGIPPETIVRIAELCAHQEVRLVIDTSYPTVLRALAFHPYLIKPNIEEMSSWLNTSAENLSLEQIRDMGRELIKKGAQQILVSLGGEGAMYIDKTQALFGNAPKIDVLNTAGAGDTMLGTFIGERAKNKGLNTSLIHSIAAGSDTARSSWITDFKNVAELEKNIHIQEV